ncbi:MAG: metalloprotease RseP [Pseudomonadota bacterium]
MTTVLAFLVALALLIAVHEYGHYRVAVACGVKVLRFSIGFGRPIWTRRRGPDQTEWVVSALPLGGYVRMLDEREGPVSAHERHRAFNNQPLWARAAVVAAGPAANLLLAVCLYAAVAWMGVEQPQPVLSSPVPGSVAEQAGVKGGEWVSAVSLDNEPPVDVRSFDDLRWQLTQAALNGQDTTLWLASQPGQTGRPVVLPLSAAGRPEADTELFAWIGIVAPWTAPVLGEVITGGAAEAAGLRSGDHVLRVNGAPVVDGQQLRRWIRQAPVVAGRVAEQRWEVDRHGRAETVLVTPRLETVGGVDVPRIGAFVGSPPAMVEVTADGWEGLVQGVKRTWEVSVLSLNMMGKMLLGEASLKNLSGPLTIADYAGKSAQIGLTAYLGFLALISVSLGVLNLLPLPVLDGGHLMYYLWEAVTGRPVSDRWMERLQRAGVAVLGALMALAVFNDIARLLG